MTFGNPEFMQHMGDTLKRVALPALALGAGTGALSGFMSSGAKPGETGQDRRHRIIRNALMGAALGGTAGVALPMGYEALTTPMHTHTAGPVEGAVDSAIGFAGRHLLPVGVAAAGTSHLLWGNRDKLKAEALEALHHTLKHSDGTKFIMPQSISTAASTPEGAADLARRYRVVQQGKDVDPTNLNSVFRANELMQEAGHKGMSFKDMVNEFETKPRALLNEQDQSVLPEGLVRQRFLEDLGNTGIVGRGIANLAKNERLPLAEQIAKVPGLGGAAELDPIQLAEAYSRFARPSVGSVLTDRMPIPLKWGLLGAGVLGANALQNRLTGQ